MPEDPAVVWELFMMSPAFGSRAWTYVLESVKGKTSVGMKEEVGLNSWLDRGDQLAIDAESNASETKRRGDSAALALHCLTMKPSTCVSRPRLSAT
jgi:hypothetical protein